MYLKHFLLRLLSFGQLKFLANRDGNEETVDKPMNAAARHYFKVAHPAFKTVQNSGLVQKKIQYIAIHGEIINSKQV